MHTEEKQYPQYPSNQLESNTRTIVIRQLKHQSRAVFFFNNFVFSLLILAILDNAVILEDDLLHSHFKKEQQNSFNKKFL